MSRISSVVSIDEQTLREHLGDLFTYSEATTKGLSDRRLYALRDAGQAVADSARGQAPGRPSWSEQVAVSQYEAMLHIAALRVKRGPAQQICEHRREPGQRSLRGTVGTARVIST